MRIVAELAQVAGEGGDVRELRPQLGRALHERARDFHLGTVVRPPARRSLLGLTSTALEAPSWESMASIQLPAPALEVRDLVKRYPTGTEALRGVSLDVRAGEFFGLLGPNGAGKSTLIHCTTGLARPTSGSVRVFGHDAVEHYEQARLAVGLAPQDVNLDWFLTLEETLDYHGGYFGMRRRERKERARELLDAFSLTAKKDDRTRTLRAA